ncbi:MAG: glycosyltransferase [Chloroflexi bacterium]|nr:glycosyltransferase [Chloroflexota bacterium]
MKILFLSRWWPFPPDNGSRMRVFQILRHLHHLGHRIDLVSFHQADQETRLEAVEYCGDVFPFLYDSFKPNRFESLLGYFSPKPRSLVGTHSPHLFQKVEELSSREQYGLVVLSQVDMLPYKKAIKNIPCFLEEIEIGVYVDRFVKQNGLRAVRERLTLSKLAAYLRVESEGLLGMSVASEKERNLVLRWVKPSCPIEVVQNGVDTDENLPLAGKFEVEPLSIVFAGSLTYSANLEAMAYFTHRVLPIILEKFSGAKLYITGKHQGCDLDQLNLIPSVVLTGYLNDVRPRVASSIVSVAPLFSGGGTRLKILESLSLGTPVVSTEKGAEGLAISAESGVLIANDPNEMADLITRLFVDPAWRAVLSERGKKSAEDQYSWNQTLRPFNRLVSDLSR